MFELAVKAHDLLGHQTTSLLPQNASWHPLGPNEVSERPAVPCYLVCDDRMHAWHVRLMFDAAQ